MSRPFDAVLFVAFGGPLGPADVRPFLANVLRGRRVSPERVEEVAHHYELFGGVSPLTELTMQQARALEAALAARGIPIPVHVGMRNWHPFIAPAVEQILAAGITHAIVICLAPQNSRTSVGLYRKAVLTAAKALK